MCKSGYLDTGQCRGLPGVIERVPLSRVGVATVSCVVTSHGGARVVRHGVQVVHCIYCERTHKHTQAQMNRLHCSIVFCLVILAWLHNTLQYCLYFIIITPTAKSLIIIKIKNRTTEVVLTAVFGSKLPQVQVLHGEVDKGGQLAGSPGFRETLQVFDRQESQGTATPHISASIAFVTSR